MQNLKQVIIIGIVIGISTCAYSAAPKCQPVEVRKAERQFKSLEFTLGEAEVDFKRVDPDYRQQLNESISRSLKNYEKSGVSDSKISRKAEELRRALEEFNAKPDEELDSTVTQVYAQFVQLFSQNPDVEYELASATLKLQMVLKRSQAIWLKRFEIKNTLFTQYVKALDEYQDMQKACRVGRYQD